MKISISVNDRNYELEVSPETSLNEVLREKLYLHGTKRGCDTGGCGTCTVIIDGKAVYSCMTPSWRVSGKKVVTVEGLEKNEKLDPIQKAFVEKMAPQCGFCTSGIIMVTKALLEKTLTPTDDEIRDSLSGVLCRCTGYIPYMEAIYDLTRRSD